MPLQITSQSIRIVWENNPDTPITASNLSKDFDYLASYQDYKLPEPALDPHREGTLIMPDDTDPLYLILKRGSMFQIINEAEIPGVPPAPPVKIIPVNSQYRVFDIGLEDLYLTVNDSDEAPITNWGNDNEWFIYICDKDDSSVYQVGSPGEYGGGAQILISRSREFPTGQVSGRLNSSHLNYGKSTNYSAKDTRMIGGFKSNPSGNIIPETVWDISGKSHTIRAKHYWVLDEYGVGPGSLYIYRQINLTDLDTSSDNVINTFGNDVTVHGNFTQDSGNNSFIGNVSIDGDFDLEASDIILDGDILIGSRVNSPIIHTGDFLNNSTNFEINTVNLNISAIENFTTSADAWTHGGSIEINGGITQNSGTVNINGNLDIDSTIMSINSTVDSHGTWDHYGNFSIHSTVNIGESGNVADLTIYSNFNQTGSSSFNGLINQVGGSVTLGSSGTPSTVNLNGPVFQNYGLFGITGNLNIANTTTNIASTNIITNTSGTFTHTGNFTMTSGDLTMTSGNFNVLNGNLNFTGDLTVGGNFSASNFPTFYISAATPSGGVHGDWWAKV